MPKDVPWRLVRSGGKRRNRSQKWVGYVCVCADLAGNLARRAYQRVVPAPGLQRQCPLQFRVPGLAVFFCTKGPQSGGGGVLARGRGGGGSKGKTSRHIGQAGARVPRS